MSADRNAAAAVVRMHALHAATPAQILAELADAADSARTAVESLRGDMTRERAERLAIHFGGMQRRANDLADAIKRTR